MPHSELYDRRRDGRFRGNNGTVYYDSQEANRMANRDSPYSVYRPGPNTPRQTNDMISRNGDYHMRTRDSPRRERHPGEDTPRQSLQRGNRYGDQRSTMPATLQAPRTSRINLNGAVQRTRTRSPARRTERSHATMRARSPIQPYHEPTVFADPYLEADRYRARRAAGEGAYRGIEYTWHRDGLPITPAGKLILDYVDNFQDLKVGPRDLDGDMLRRVPPKQSINLIRINNILNAHFCGNMYDDKYKGDRFEHNLENVLEYVEPGSVITFPIIERLADDNVGIQSLDRINSIHGPAIDKSRTDIVTKVKGLDAQVLSLTSFNGQGEPPPDIRNEYARVTHIYDKSDPIGAQGLPVIRFEGSDHLSRVSYVRFTQPTWINLKRTPFAKEGSLVADDFEVVADLLGFKPQHRLRGTGKRLRQERDARVEARARRVLAAQVNELLDHSFS